MKVIQVMTALMVVVSTLLPLSSAWSQGEEIQVLEVEFDKEYVFDDNRLVFIQGPGEYILEWEDGTREMSLEKGEEKLIEIRPGDRLIRY